MSIDWQPSTCNPVQRRFFLYVLILFLTNQASIMGFRAIAAVCRAVVVTNMVRRTY